MVTEIYVSIGIGSDRLIPSPHSAFSSGLAASLPDEAAEELASEPCDSRSRLRAFQNDGMGQPSRSLERMPRICRPLEVAV